MQKNKPIFSSIWFWWFFTYLLIKEKRKIPWNTKKWLNSNWLAKRKEWKGKIVNRVISNQQTDQFRLKKRLSTFSLLCFYCHFLLITAKSFFLGFFLLVMSYQTHWLKVLYWEERVRLLSGGSESVLKKKTAPTPSTLP